MKKFFCCYLFSYSNIILNLNIDFIIKFMVRLLKHLRNSSFISMFRIWIRWIRRKLTWNDWSKCRSYLIWKVLMLGLCTCKAFWCSLNFFFHIIANEILCATGPKKMPEVEYFSKSSIDLKKRSLKWKFNT